MHFQQLRKNKAATTGKNLDDAANDPDVNDISSIVADRLKSHDTAVHALMAQEWRSINCAADLATKAEFLVSQTGPTTAAYFTRHSANSTQDDESSDKQLDEKKSRKWRDPCPNGRNCADGKRGKCELYHGRNFRRAPENDPSSEEIAADIAVLEAKLAAFEASQSTVLPIESSSMFI